MIEDPPAVRPVQRPDDDSSGDVAVEKAMIAKALGGWRGVFDSGIPSLTFVIAYLATGQNLKPSLGAAIAAGIVIVIVRLVQRQGVQQVISGFLGLAFSAWLASRSGRAEDFFLPGLLLNGVYAAVFLISILIRRPLMAYAIGAISGDVSGWLTNPRKRRAATAATSVWVVLFFGKLVIQVPLYWAGAVAALGVARVLLGYPLLALGAYLNFRLIQPVMHADPEVVGASESG